MSSHDHEMKPSGKVKPSFFLLFPLALLLTCLLAALYQGILYINPFIYFNVLAFGGMCVVVFVVTNFLGQMGHCRNSTVSGLAGVILGGAALYTSFVVLIGNLAELPYVDLFLAPDTVWGLIELVGAQGYYSVFDATFNGGVLWGTWIIEAIGLVGVPAVMGWSTTGEQLYCESCGKWAETEENIAVFAFEDEEALKTSFKNADMGFLHGAAPVEATAASFYSLDAQICDGSTDLSAMSLVKTKLSLNKEGKVEETKDILVSNIGYSQAKIQKVAGHLNGLIPTG